MSKSGTPTMLERIDRRWIFLIIIILCILPVVRPLGLPIQIEPATLGVYNTIQNLKPGDIACITVDYGGGSAAELYPQDVDLAKILLARDCKLIIVCFDPAGPQMGNNVLQDSGYVAAKTYGVDYVNLGYIAGTEAGMSAFAKDIRATIQSDFYGTPLSQLSIMNNVNTENDIKFLAFTTSTSQDMYIRQFSGHTTQVVGCIQALYYSIMAVYMNSHQIIGFVNGLRGDAEIELLTGYPGTGVITMDQTSITHLFAVALIVIGNVGYWRRKK